MRTLSTRRRRIALGLQGPTCEATRARLIRQWGEAGFDVSEFSDQAKPPATPARGLQQLSVDWSECAEPMVRIIPAIRTAYREQPTLRRTVESLQAGGFEAPLIFAEPDSPTHAETLRWESQIGPFQSFRKMCDWLLSRHGCEWFLLCEDDVVFQTGVADYVRSAQINRDQVVSFYLSADQDAGFRSQTADVCDTCNGFMAITGGEMFGSLAYLVHASALRTILASDTITNWNGRARVDRAFSAACHETGTDLLIHRPALAEHIGATSTINARRQLDTTRTTRDFSDQRRESPLVTLITPTGDRPEAFALCERWMARQRYTGEIQWIVVDDGRDPTRCTMSQEYIRRDPGSGHTLCANLRAALPAIRGAKILVIEDDEYYGPDYLSVMAGQLDQADYVGERASKYYWPRERRWMQYPRFHHVALCRLGFTAAVLPTFTAAITGTDDRTVDERIAARWNGSRSVWIDTRGDMRLGVGIKGMPGRKCGVSTPPRHAVDDPDGRQLRRMVGGDAVTYLPLYETTTTRGTT